MSSVTENLVIEELAASEAALLERVASLEADNRTFRELAVAGFDALRASELKNSRLRADLERERIENARLREHILERELAA